MGDIDQVVRGVGKEGWPAGCGRPTRLRVGERNTLWDGCTQRFVVQSFQIFAYSSLAVGRILPDMRFIARHGQLGACLGLNNAGIYGKAFALDQTGGHAGTHDFVKHPTKRPALTKPPVAILGKGRMVRYDIFQTEVAEPTVGQVQVHFLA